MMKPTDSVCARRTTLPALTAAALCLTMSLGLCFGLAGCMKQRRGPDMAARMLNAPPVRIDSSEDVHILVMQAPNPGWSFELDRDEKTPKGKRVFLTMRRPDPTMLYPQVIVEKQLRTLVRSETELTISGRMLDHKETTKKRGYAPIDPVDSFEE